MAADDQRTDMRGSSSRLPLWTGLGGFVLGAVFWHLVGFWSLVSDVAFNNKGDEKSPTRLINLDEVAAVKAARDAAARPLPAARTEVSGRQAAAGGGAEAAGAGAERATPDGLAELLQCSEARRGADGQSAEVTACPPLSRRLPTAVDLASRADREMDAREAADRLLRGWDTGVSRIETGTLQAAR